MKRYTVSRYFWLNMSIAVLGVADAFIGFVNAFQGKGWTASLPWELFAVGCGVVSFILFMRGERIHPVEVKPIEESAEYIHYLRGKDYAIKEELVRRQRHLERLESDQKGILKWAFGGVFLVGIGVFFFWRAIPDIVLTNKVVARAWFSLAYPALALGSILIIAGFRMIWISIINSDSEFTRNLADKYTLDTYPVRISREKILIGVISDRLEKEKELERKKREERLAKEKEMVNELAAIPLNLDLRG